MTTLPLSGHRWNPQTRAERPIVVIDSGVGGLTVAKALRHLLPGERIIYFGDTARLPYGNKSKETVTRFVTQIIRHLLPTDPKHIVLACNTASALALGSLRGAFAGLSLSGVIEPGARAAAEAAGEERKPVIGVIATEATIRSKAYEVALLRRRRNARLLLKSTPLLVPIIEENRSPHDPLVRLAVQQYLKPMQDRGLQVLLLGCTHYPIIEHVFAEVAGGAVKVVNSAVQCALDVAERLKEAGRLSPNTQPGTFDCYVTDDPAKFQKLARRILQMDLAEPTLINPDKLYEPEPLHNLRVPA